MDRSNLGQRRAGRFSLAAAAVIIFGMAAPALAFDEATCMKAAGVAVLEPRPLRVTLDPRQPLNIVAIGSSSTAGHGTIDRSKAYPRSLEKFLSKRLPHAQIHVFNRGKGGETIPDMVARFEQDVFPLMPHVVIWQLGVNDVLVADGVGDRRAKMLEGLRALTERRIPVMLLDLQYAPRVLRDPDTEAMQAMIEQATANGGVVYRFKRYAAMKHLVERENLAVDKLIEADGLHMTLSMHDCIGRLLAEAIQEKTDVETALR